MKTLKEKVEEIVHRSQFDPTDITYWDGIVPEIVELVATEKEAALEEFKRTHKTGFQQNEWQKRQVAQGKCQNCGKPRSKTAKNYCEFHRVKHNLRNRLAKLKSQKAGE